MKRRRDMMKNRKYGLIGLVLTISMLLTFSTLSPYAAAETPVFEGEMRLTVYPNDAVDADADGNDKGSKFADNPVRVIVDVIVNDAVGGSNYYFYLNITNRETEESDDNEYDWSDQGGPTYIDTTIDAEVDASVGDHIDVYIYCNVTHWPGPNFAEDDHDYTITLTT